MYRLLIIYHIIILGDGEDYLNLALKEGGISVSINLGSGTLNTGIGLGGSVRFDDDQWHHVSLKRVAQKVRSSAHHSFFCTTKTVVVHFLTY